MVEVTLETLKAWKSAGLTIKIVRPYFKGYIVQVR